jgi:hypothetical protein
LVLAFGLAGCAAQNGHTLVGFTDGGDCQTVRQQLRKLDAAGVPAQIQAHAAGQPVSGTTKANIDLYNRLLEEYLGNNCQLPPGS